jgi:hypothetical protein
MEFIEATAFTKYVYDYLTEDEYLGLQGFLLQNPEAGKIVRGSGGVRKVRWQLLAKVKAVPYVCFTSSRSRMMKSGC